MNRIGLFSALAILVTACGGGGSGGGGGNSSWLSFDPASIDITVNAGQAASISLTATARSAPTVEINAAVILDANFDGQNIQIYPSGLSYTATFQTVSTLAGGVHEGSLEVRVCEDDPLVCTKPYGGSPWHVPYRIAVASGPVTVPLDFALGEVSANGGDYNNPLVATFAADGSISQAGTNSLQITGPIVKNYWGDDYVIDVHAFLNEERTPIDFTGRTLSAYFHLGDGTSTVQHVEVALVDSSDRPLQGMFIPVTHESWQHVTFNPATDQINYTRPGFDITQVNSISLRIATSRGTVQEAVWNVDSITW